jgi:hypothetical protein
MVPALYVGYFGIMHTDGKPIYTIAGAVTIMNVD